MPDPITAHYTGTLAEMFADALRHYAERIEPSMWDRGKEAACWLEYHGPDCAPFRGYFRFRKTKSVIASIFAVGPSDQIYRKGRMPKIIDALAHITKTVEVESVINVDLAAYLRGVGFTEDTERPGTYVKVFE